MKNPKRQYQGRKNKANGKRFEERISASLEYYAKRGFAEIEKTPEPMRVLRRLDENKFISVFEKKAQPDYKGVIKGGREILIEAKYTDTDRISQDRVNAVQSSYMERHIKLGARGYVIAGFASENVYMIPWPCWAHMKERFGRKYVTEADLEKFRVSLSWNGVLLLLP